MYLSGASFIRQNMVHVLNDKIKGTELEFALYDLNQVLNLRPDSVSSPGMRSFIPKAGKTRKKNKLLNSSIFFVFVFFFLCVSNLEKFWT